MNISLKYRNIVKNIDIKSLFDEHPYPQGIWPDNHSPLFDYFEHMLIQIITSYSAIEAFSNISIPNDFIYKAKRKDGKCLEEYDKIQIERHLNLDTKLDKILPDIFKIKSPKGGKLWENYLVHKSLRDRIVHLKSVDVSASGPEKVTLWGDLLKHQQTNFPKDIHNLIGHYIRAKDGFRWFEKFPYSS